MTTASKPRSDRENLAILEELRPRWEKLHEERIRNDSDLRRHEAETGEATRDAEAKFGTSNVDELRKVALDGYATNTSDVDTFSEAISAVEQEVERIHAEEAQGA